MTDLTIIPGPWPLDQLQEGFPRVLLTADRATLLKRRWRGVAGNGKEFGFDLEQPLVHGNCFYVDSEARYVIAQTPEDVLEVRIEKAETAARLGWQLGNLHLIIEILPGGVRVANDPVARKALADAGFAFEQKRGVFRPSSSGGHHHHHEHSHE